jgi:hypothetical protein
MTNSTDTRKASGSSIRFDRISNTWTGYSWERVTCLQVDSWPVTGDMTEPEARAWLAA